MQIRTKLPIVTMVGAGALLLCALAAIIAFRAQVANASIRPPHGEDRHGPYVEITLDGRNDVAPGENLQFTAFSSTVCPAQRRGESDGCDLPNDQFAATTSNTSTRC